VTLTTAGLPATSRCTRCGQPIAWGLTLPARRRMPIDPQRRPDDDHTANILVSGDPHGSILCRVESRAEPIRDGERRYMPHWATCPATNFYDVDGTWRPRK